MKFNVKKVNAPHAQPGTYKSHGESGQSVGFVGPSNGNVSNHSSAISSNPVEVRARDMGRTPTAVPTNNSNPVHTKHHVTNTRLD